MLLTCCMYAVVHRNMDEAANPYAACPEMNAPTAAAAAGTQAMLATARRAVERLRRRPALARCAVSELRLLANGDGEALDV